MKKKSFLFLILFNASVVTAQQTYLDSLKHQLSLNDKPDTSRVLALFSLADYYGFLQFDSCLFYAAQTTELSQKLNYPFGKFLGYWSTFHGLNSQGNYSMALAVALKMEKAGEEIKKDSPWVMPQVYYFLGLLDREMSQYSESKVQFQKSIALQQSIGEPIEDAFASFSQLGILYASLHQMDSALYFAQKGYELGLRTKRYKIYFPLAITAIGNINVALGKFDMAHHYFLEAIEECKLNNNAYFQARNFINLATLFNKINRNDSAIYYAGIAVEVSQQHNFAEFILNASKVLTNTYESEHNPDSSLKYLKLMIAAKDSVFSQSKVQQFQQSTFNEIQRQEQANLEKERYQYRIKIYALVTSLIVFLLIAFILYRNSRQKQRDKLKIEKAYSELKSTQAQLIQSEKMASLGEMSAGIAHEIQNPLNFVNNFSEVNAELIDELQQEVDKGNLDEVKAIAKDLAENEQKINHHGKRADAIIKGMLQHSRTGGGQKEPTDINALADEYLRLSYHSVRAKDTTFHATLKTDFDSLINKINIIPGDIGKVLLNLYNNAFYAVNEKVKSPGALKGRKEYEPTVAVSTRYVKSPSGDLGVLLTVKDNGNGIPQKIVDKIFQPFFTTKPTGEGTGLGLSLSYDIIKAHGGEIKVETKEGEETEFIIQIPF